MLASGCGRAARPADAVRGLYRAAIDSQVTGAPTVSQLAALRPFLGAELAALLDSARSLRDAEAAANPGEKPPFAEGDLFSSLFEGSTEVEDVAPQGDGTRFLARLADARATPPVRWTDTVLVGEEDGRPVVTDVRYGGSWDFANRGSLVGSLREGLRAAAGGDPNVLRFDGIGVIRIGMRVADVERRVGDPARVDRIDPDDACGYAYLKALPAIALMLAGDTVVRVDVGAAGPRTEAGVGIGTAESEVLARYRGVVRVEPHPYTGPEGHYLIVDDSDRPGLRLIFETDGRVVTAFRAGRLPEADLIEGCS